MPIADVQLSERPLFTDYIHHRINLREPNTPWMSKVGMASFAANLGFKVPNTLFVLSRGHELTADMIGDGCVVKPSDWWSRRGVMILTYNTSPSFTDRLFSKNFYDSLNGRTLSLRDIRNEQEHHRKAYLKKRPGTLPAIIVEEFIADESSPDIVPFDYKIYAFNGNVKFIVQIDRNIRKPEKPRIAFFSGDFTPLDFEKYMKPGLRNAQFGVHRQPKCWREMLDAAKKISYAISSPFIRVDTYASTTGPVIGELTPTPGGPLFGMWRFQDWYNQELGDAWTQAACDLNAEGRKFDTLVYR